MAAHPKKKKKKKPIKGSFKPFKIPGGRKKKGKKSKNVGGTTFFNK